ncbi:hypothetical protein KIW84_050376 [Lathyrus oleraceus]|uniref:Retrovirus-related Pol polyprotein from transposon TNT 1-94-like beta-barrel domain-containing protein n=1 Tax=Pisum sativum TaxID=3888 RepID=A0A9D4WID3_PEA|nr:hypothetical protein KIW84_050376 [Pisum sativum]
MGQTTIVEKVLRSMHTKFNYVVCFIKESNDITSLSIDELKSSLLVHEQRIKITQEKEDEHVLKIASYGRGGITNQGDDSMMKVRGKGNLKLHKNGITQVIIDVYYLLYLKNNLLSVSQLMQKEQIMVFKDGGLDTLIKKDMVKGMPSLKDLEETCSDCLMGKKHRESITKQVTRRAKEKYELIDSDVCGPIKPGSNDGSRYFITFTYDFSRKTWIYFFHEGAGAFDVFK